MLPIALAAYLILFILVGVLFLFVSLLLGRFLRPHAPSASKGEPYECGEPAVGSSYVQFDLRFYVVALLFIIFEVELAFFFPPAVVFGKINQLRGSSVGPIVERPSEPQMILTPAAKEKFEELSIPAESIEQVENNELKGRAENDAIAKNASVTSEMVLQDNLQWISLMALLDMAVFFVVLLVGFAYLWKMGDLNWVRAYTKPSANDANSHIGLAVVRQSGEGP
jgi:NADH-quinone oxidoreductase subunit A